MSRDIILHEDNTRPWQQRDQKLATLASGNEAQMALAVVAGAVALVVLATARMAVAVVAHGVDCMPRQ
jgi:uncharacterized membrane protein